MVKSDGDDSSKVLNLSNRLRRLREERFLNGAVMLQRLGVDLFFFFLTKIMWKFPYDSRFNPAQAKKGMVLNPSQAERGPVQSGSGHKRRGTVCIAEEFFFPFPLWYC